MHTNKSSTRRSLLVSATALILSIAMLVGTTFAWFTDTASSGVNKIVAGNLDIEVSYKDGENWPSIENATSLFSSNLWEPGHTEFVTLKIENKGTLALKYKLMVTPVSENGGINVNNTPFKLSDYLVFGTTNPGNTAPSYTRETARTAVGDTCGLNDVNSLTKEYTMMPREVSPQPSGEESTQYVTLVVYMPENVGNEANYKTGTTPPTIDLGIKVVATQVENEKDSFSDDYDADADLDSEYIAGPYYEYFKAVKATGTSEGDKSFTIYASDGATAVDQNNPVKVTGTTTNAGDTVDVVVTKTEAPSEIVVTPNRAAVAYDVKVTGQAPGSPVTVELYIGTQLSNFNFYHNETEMTQATGTLGNGQYTYDPVTGIITFMTDTFSPFTGVFDDAVATIVNGNGVAMYGTLAAAGTAAADGDTIRLLKDAAGNGLKFNQPKNITIDFNGFTYNIDGETVGSTGTETSAFQLLKDNTITFKNGTLTSTKARILIQNYCDLTLENMYLDGSQLVGGSPYTLSNNCGTVNITGNTSIIANQYGYAFDAFYWPDGGYGEGVKVIVDTTGTISGTIEYGSDGTTDGMNNISQKASIELLKGNFENTSFSLYSYNGIPNIKKSSSVDVKAPSSFFWNEDGTLTKAAAYVNGAYYADLQEALNVGGYVSVQKDLDIADTLIVDKTVTLNLNGYTISNSTNIWNDDTDHWSLISVRGDGNLTIKGSGTLDAKEYDCFAVDVYDEGATCTIKNGTFNGNLHSVYVYSGKLNIEGGKFDIYQTQTSGDPYGFLLNCHDASYKAGKASIQVSGGEFYKYNPATSASESPVVNFVVEGKTTIQDGEWYKVIDASPATEAE